MTTEAWLWYIFGILTLVVNSKYLLQKSSFFFYLVRADLIASNRYSFLSISPNSGSTVPIFVPMSALANVHINNAFQSLHISLQTH